jgi:chromosome segregation ATPase
MSPEKTPFDAENTDKADIKTEAVSDNSESKLLKFDENNSVSPGKDINTKITALDTDLAQLRAELSAINSSVEEGLDRLGDTDTDLTAKVSETYKRLGEIDNAYKALLGISSRIDSDIKKLNGDVSTVAVQSATGIKTLEQSTIAQSNEFAHKNEQVVSRVNHLVETSKLTGDLLSQKIQATTEKMLQFETKVVAEIESLSNTTKDKTDAIETSVESNKAKILKLQSVDEAIIKRATTLEITSAELSVKSQDIQSSVEQLQMSTNSLSSGLDELREQTRALEDITNNHGSLITGLQKASSDLTEKLTVLAGRESKHFNIVTASFLLLLIVTAVIYFTQQKQFDVTDAKIAGNSEKVDAQITGLQQIQSDTAAATGDTIIALEEKIDELSTTMQQDIAQVDRKMKEMQDQVQSVDGRLTNEAPYSQIGNDNIIHGEQWIAALPKQNFTVQLAYVDSQSAMYELAQDYSYYLKNSLSYFEVEDNGVTRFVLLSGNYTTQQQAAEKIQSMPRYINRQQPVVKKLDDVQRYIAQKI